MTYYYVLLIISIFGIQQSFCGERLVEKWNNFKESHNKLYETLEEEEFRLKIFLKNLYNIDEHNLRYKQGRVSYELGINHFMDFTEEDLKNFAHGLLMPSVDQITLPPHDIEPENITSSVPDSIDWRTHNVIPPVKDQGKCGSCWAFSAISALEALTNIKFKKHVSLSEQNLIDCSTRNSGCNGGWPSEAYEYIIENEGIASEKSYPYKAVQGTCNYNPENKGATVSDVKTIDTGNENDLKTVVGTIGPVSVCISVPNNFFLYKRGIFDDHTCNHHPVGHAVTVIGYGTENGVDYWLVRNSWSTIWGDKGYIKMRRNRNNMCHIASYAVYPVVS